MQLRRDRLTFAMMIGVPIMQLVLFGYAINGDPRHLPTAVVAPDNGPLVRSIVRAAENTGYFRVVAEVDRRRGRAPDRQRPGAVRAGLPGRLLAPRCCAASVRRSPCTPTPPTRPPPAPRWRRCSRCRMLALAARPEGCRWRTLRPGDAPFELRLHRRYNPEGLTAYNVVPGLMGVILTMTLVMMTAMAMTRERERGTLEKLLATPVRPLEMMVGKILPYVLIGYVQVLIVFAAARLLFDVPMAGSFALLSAMVLLFIVATLTVGFTFSTIARSQMQAHADDDVLLPAEHPALGLHVPVPRHAAAGRSALGEVLPLTHFLRIVRGIMLKGAARADLWPRGRGHRGLHGRRRRHRDAALPADDRLTGAGRGHDAGVLRPGTAGMASRARC